MGRGREGRRFVQAPCLTYHSDSPVVVAKKRRLFCFRIDHPSATAHFLVILVAIVAPAQQRLRFRFGRGDAAAANDATRDVGDGGEARGDHTDRAAEHERDQHQHRHSGAEAQHTVREKRAGVIDSWMD